MASSAVPTPVYPYETRHTKWYFGYQAPAFDSFWTPQKTATTGTGDPAVAEVEDGEWLFDSGTDINGECSLFSKKIFVLRDGVSFKAQAMIRFTQNVTSKAGIYFGFTSSPGAGFLTDTTLLPEASMIGASLYTTIDNLYWHVGAENNTTRDEEQTNLVAGGAVRPNGTNRHIIEIRAKCIGTEVYWQYFVNERYPTGNSSLRTFVASKSFTFGTTNTAMAIQIGVKNGSAAQEDLSVVNIGYTKTYRMP